MTILVLGHKAPDTDSTGSPIIWAWYLSEKLGKPAEARLLGEPNTEAAFVLDRWSLDKPQIIDDAYLSRCVALGYRAAGQTRRGGRRGKWRRQRRGGR